MAFEFKLPDLGEGVQEGEIVRWLVQVGDVVAPEQHLVEVMTDKVTAELPAPVGGRILALHGDAGEVVPVGHVLVEIEDAGSDSGNGGPGGRETVQTDLLTRAAEEAAPRAAGKSRAVPAVRKLAKELGVDLASLRGSGPAGRILEADVRSAVPGGTGTQRSAEVRRIPLRGVRRTIAEHLLTSHRETAPYTYVEEVDFTELVSLRERVQPMAEKAGVRLTYLPLILAAVSMALREHPHLNAVVEPGTGDLLIQPEHHFSMAVHTEDGLVVPVIRDVQRRNLLNLAAEIERLSNAARGGKLSREEVAGGTFSITSLGALGGLMGTPMLNTPQVAILGVHKICARPVVREGAIVSRQMGNLSLTLDHRYIDGIVGARFAQALKQYLEDPALMLFWLAEIKDGSGDPEPGARD
jgi:pyruvate/2-oxoglutarate dehydrogenase complex dihydrolipoamide acyltransferase (E2) component